MPRSYDVEVSCSSLSPRVLLPSYSVLLRPDSDSAPYVSPLWGPPSLALAEYPSLSRLLDFRDAQSRSKDAGMDAGRRATLRAFRRSRSPEDYVCG